ncbi:beta strand repeat-containing protein [Fimbriimonas ginsengisoli]|nr:hypothetical protein [Fimbriimonas ginsengisoli]
MFLLASVGFGQGPAPSSLTFNPASVVGSKNSIATLTLSGPAPAGGLVVTLSDDSPSANEPASVTVPAGQKSTVFNVSTVAVPTDTNVTITATAGASSAQGVLTITAPRMVSLTASPTTILGGAKTTITATISSVAPAGGFTLSIASNNSAVIPASTITILAGGTSRALTLTSASVPANTLVTLSTGLNGSIVSTGVTVLGVSLASLSVSPTSVVGGNSATVTATLTNEVPPGTTFVFTPSSSSPSISVPASVSVVAGASSATYTATTVPVATNLSATLSASAGGATVSTPFSVTAPTLVSFSYSPTTIAGGGATTGTITISSAAPAGGLPIALTIDKTVASVPASVSVPAGATTCTFTSKSAAVAADVTATATAKLNGASLQAQFKITAPTLISLGFSPPGVSGGVSSTGTATISSPAPKGGLVVALKVDKPAASVPASVTVLQGATSASFVATTTPVAADTVVTGTATLAGISQTAQLTVRFSGLVSLTMSPSSVNGGASSTGTVTLASPAPAGGTLVNLSSNVSAVVTPSSVTIPEGQSSATFTAVTSQVAGDTTATITATAAGTTVSGTLTVVSYKMVSLEFSPTTVVGGSSSVGTVTISAPAPAGGILIALSKDKPAVTVPSTVSVAEGATTATFTATTVAVASDVTANVTGSFSGTSATGPLKLSAPTISSFAFSPNSVTGGQSSTGTVTLSSAAATGGVAVALASNSSAVPVPSSVTVPAGATSVTFNVTTTSVSADTTGTVTATLNGANTTAQLGVTAPSITSIVFSPNSVVGGVNSTGTMTLLHAAPAGGETITIASSKPSVRVPASVFVPAGATKVTFRARTSPVLANLSAVVTATLNGESTSGTLTVKAPTITSVTVSPSSITLGTPGVITVTISSPAPHGYFAVSFLPAGDALGTPAPLLIPAGQTVGHTMLPTNALNSLASTPATATISASLNNVNTKSNSFTLTAPALTAQLTSQVSELRGGTSTPGFVSTNIKAGGLKFTLTSSDPAAVGVPSTVTIPTGSHVVAFTITTSAVATSKTVTVTATANGVSATEDIYVQGPAYLDAFPTGGKIGLQNPAPAGGLTFSLSSSSGVMTVPSTVTIPAGATSASYAATSANVDSDTVVTVSATLNGTTLTRDVLLRPTSFIVQVIPSELTGGSQAVLKVILSSPAPAGGSVLQINSSSASGGLPFSVTVPEGQTQASVLFTTSPVSFVTPVTITPSGDFPQPVTMYLDPAPTDLGERVFFEAGATLQAGSGGLSPGVGIYSVNMDGTNVQTYSNTAHLLDVSLDGSVILADDGSSSYTFIDALSGATAPGPPRTVGTTSLTNPKFFPDGRSLLFQADATTMGIYDMSTGIITSLVPMGGSILSYSVLADGDFYVQVADGAFSDLYRVQGGSPAQIINGFAGNLDAAPGRPAASLMLISKKLSVGTWQAYSLNGTQTTALISSTAYTQVSAFNYFDPVGTFDGNAFSVWSDQGGIVGIYSLDNQKPLRILFSASGLGNPIFRIIPIIP